MPALDQIVKAGNEALNINKPTGADFHLTTDGSDWLWAAFSCFALFGAIMHLLMFRKPAKERVFYYTTVVPAWIMTIAYFTWASDLGWAPVQAEFNHVTTSTQATVPGYRQVFYLKSINWFLCFPFHTFALGLLSGTPGGQTAYNMFLTDVFVVALLAGSVTHSTYKWGYFTVGVAAIFGTLANLFTTSRKSALKIGQDCGSYFTWYASGFAFLWLIYPIAWALAEGGNVIQPDSEAVFCGVLDICLFIIVPGIFFFFTYDFNLDRVGLLSHEFQNMGSKEMSGLSHASARASGETAVLPNSPSVQSTPASATPPETPAV
jgi:bacteriorhodopsin